MQAAHDAGPEKRLDEFHKIYGKKNFDIKYLHKTGKISKL